MKKEEKAIIKKVPYPLNDGTYTIFENITPRQKDILDVYESLMKYLWKLEKQNQAKITIKDGKTTKYTSRSNNKKSSRKASAKKSSRNKKV